MSRIRSKDTKPEIAVRSLLHSMGFRFRLHKGELPGNPDIVLSRLKTVVFIHGCFWHRHKGCRDNSNPATNSEFWQAKFQRNVARDKRNASALRRLGWKVITVWECELKKPSKLESRLRRLLPAEAGNCEFSKRVPMAAEERCAYGSAKKQIKRKTL